MSNDHDKSLLSRIFSLSRQENKVPDSWKKWREGKSNYKPFSLQLNDCKKNSIYFIKNCYICGHTISMCRKYGGQCISHKCKPERIKGPELPAWPEGPEMIDEADTTPRKEIK